MKIKEFNDDVFFDFASRKIGTNVQLFNNDMVFQKSDKAVTLLFYVGGESADARKFVFTDDSCSFVNGYFNSKQDLGREWITYLSEEVCDSEDEANYFIDAYNKRLEDKIAQYTKAKRDMMINL